MVFEKNAINSTAIRGSVRAQALLKPLPTPPPSILLPSIAHDPMIRNSSTILAIWMCSKKGNPPVASPHRTELLGTPSFHLQDSLVHGGVKSRGGSRCGAVGVGCGSIGVAGWDEVLAHLCVELLDRLGLGAAGATLLVAATTSCALGGSIGCGLGCCGSWLGLRLGLCGLLSWLADALAQTLGLDQCRCELGSENDFDL